MSLGGDQYTVASQALVAAAEGNLYHLVNGGDDATWLHTAHADSVVTLFPHDDFSTQATTIVKTTASGNYLWHSSLRNAIRGGSSSCLGNNLLRMGDTAASPVGHRRIGSQRHSQQRFACELPTVRPINGHRHHHGGRR